ncbi:MAG: hypothetical protein PHS59_18285 [Paludibacter sp.]|nr:hypothetical protein [Paludibacter sp.]
MEKGPSTWGEDWTSEFSEEEHFDRHGSEMGFETMEEYSNAARNFAKSKERGIKSFRSIDGSTQKFNSRTNEFMIISKIGKIVTFFEPERGINYFYEQFDKYGNYLIV